MAINLNQQNPNNQQGQQQGQVQPGQPMQQPQGFNKPKGTGFTNLQRVLGANKDNKLGQAVGQGVQNISNKTQTQTQGAQENFAKDIGSAVKDIKSGQKIQENLSGADFTKDSDAAANKIQEIGSDEYVNASKNLRGGYQGPQGLENASQLQSQAQQLGQTAQGLLTNSGRQAALQRFVNAGPNYTQGKQALDNMLLGQGNNNQVINQARRGAAQTAEATNQAINQAAQQGQFTGQQFNALGQDITGKTQALGQNLGAALDTRAQGRVADAQKQVADLKAALQSGNLDQSQYNFLVDDVLNGTNTYNYNKDQIAGLVQANTDYNKSNVANQNEVGARDALARLAGLDSGDTLLDLDEAKAGTAAASGYQVNKTAQQQFLDAKNEADRAKAAFSLTPTGGPYATTNGQYNAIDYDKAAKINDAYMNLARQGKGQEAFNQLQQQGIFTNMNDGGAQAFANNSAEQTMAYAPISDPYRQITEKYGLGKNLQSLLANNKTFGVS